jgi:uncharacterized protein
MFPLPFEGVMSVIVRLEDIPAEGLDVTVGLPGGALDKERVSPLGPVLGEFHLVRRGSSVTVEGRVRGRVIASCSRCLADAEAPVDEVVTVEFRPLPESGGERELTGGDLDVDFYRGGSIDMAGFLTEQVRLALPMKPLCSQRCPGLCSVCGRPRQEGCGCAERPADHRWEALRGLLHDSDDEKR